MWRQPVLRDDPPKLDPLFDVQFRKFSGPAFCRNRYII